MASNCDCHTGGCEIDLTGIGQVGATGAQGGYGGWSSLWNFSTTTTTGTTAGQLRMNNATYASVTSIYINTTNADSTDVSNFLASFTNGTYYGKIRIFKESDNTKFWEGSVTNVSVSGSEYTLTVTYTLANSTFAASDKVVLTFTPNGQGSKPLLFSDAGNFSVSNTGSWTTIPETTFTVPAGLLSTNGDCIEVIVQGTLGATSTFTDYNAVRLLVNGTGIVTVSPGYGIGYSEMLHNNSINPYEFQIRCILERITATTVSDNTLCVASGLYTHTYYSDIYTMNNLSSSTNDISVQAFQDSDPDTVIVFSIKVIKLLQ